MKDPELILRTKLFERINNINVAGIGAIPAFDVVPKNQNYPYIYFGEYNFIEEGDKSAYGSRCTQLIEVVTGFKGDKSGSKQSDQITNAVVTAIRTRTSNKLDLSPDFNLIITVIESINKLKEITESQTIIRKLIRVRFIVEQLTNNS